MSSTNLFLELNKTNPAMLEDAREFAMMATGQEVRPSIWQLEYLMTTPRLLQFVMRYGVKPKKGQDPIEALIEQGDQTHTFDEMPEGYDANGDPIELDQLVDAQAK